MGILSSFLLLSNTSFNQLKDVDGKVKGGDLSILILEFESPICWIRIWGG
jgi:hypothetical protein